MRIERIESPTDFARWLLDQLAHALIVFGATAPVLAWGLWGVIPGGVVILAVREYEQWDAKTPERKYAETLDPWYIRHLDRTLDVVLGVAGGAVLVGWLL